MKKRISLLLIATMVMSMLAGCGATATKEAETSVETETVEATDVAAEAAVMSVEAEVEEAHEHVYTETITTEATCETDGEATFTCECGDSYTEPIATQGHVFENYTSNNDATFTADGTETAKCNNCDVTDTRTAEGSMLTYTYTDMDATMYAQKTVNVRSLPNTDGEKLGSLSTNDEVKVTGQCVETSWYRIEYSGGVAYVSNSYLGNDKVVVQTEAPKQNTSSVSLGTAQEAYDYAVAQGYPVYQAVDNGDGTATYYYLNINEVLPSDQSAFVTSNYEAARDVAFGYVWQYYGVPYSKVKETVGHYATLDSRWSIKSRTASFNGYIN